MFPQDRRGRFAAQDAAERAGECVLVDVLLAVGDAPDTGKAKIMWTESPSITPGVSWQDASVVIETVGTNSIGQPLRAVAWAGGETFWAAGASGAGAGATPSSTSRDSARRCGVGTPRKGNWSRRYAAIGAAT